MDWVRDIHDGKWYPPADQAPPPPSSVKPRRIWPVVLAAVAALWVAGLLIDAGEEGPRDSETIDTLARAWCSDLDAGLAINQISMGAVRSKATIEENRLAGAQAAAAAFRAVTKFCPEWAADLEVRRYLEGWNYQLDP